MKNKIMKSLWAALLTACVTCPHWQTMAEEAPEGYLLNLYHFNIQYVVGHERSMQRIVKQSFEPLVDFYIDHPQWGADFEMQGVMIEYMGENYPDVLEKFKTIVNSGQVELVTFHYADQLLLAFPAHDQEWSLRLNDEILEKYGIRRSKVIFAQEAQFGEGMCALGKEHGYDVAIMTTSGYKWFQDDDRFPYFSVQGMEVLTNRQAEHPRSGIEVKWMFLGDGELVVTGGFSPYFPGLFHKNPVRIALLEKQMKAARDQGYEPSTISSYVEALRREGVEPQELGPILDSPWRPEDGSGVLQWMGRYSFPWEKDYDIRTKNWQVRAVLIEAERAGASQEVLAKAWAHMLNAEVSDPTGWFPLPVEIRFDYEQMDMAIEALEEDASIDIKAIKDKARQRPECTKALDRGPVRIRTFGNDTDYKWAELQGGPGGYCLDVSWAGKGDSGVAFPFKGDYIEYSPAMMEDTIKYIPLKDIKKKTIHLGLPNGLIGLGNDTYLVRDNAAGTVGTGLYLPDHEIVFEVQKGREDAYSFRFYVLTDTSAPKALGFANRINRVRP